jgi:hypothetical protein
MLSKCPNSVTYITFDDKLTSPCSGSYLYPVKFYIPTEEEKIIHTELGSPIKLRNREMEDVGTSFVWALDTCLEIGRARSSSKPSKILLNTAQMKRNTKPQETELISKKYTTVKTCLSGLNKCNNNKTCLSHAKHYV